MGIVLITKSIRPSLTLSISIIYIYICINFIAIIIKHTTNEFFGERKVVCVIFKNMSHVMTKFDRILMMNRILHGSEVLMLQQLYSIHGKAYYQYVVHHTGTS